MSIFLSSPTRILSACVVCGKNVAAAVAVPCPRCARVLYCEPACLDAHRMAHAGACTRTYVALALGMSRDGASSALRDTPSTDEDETAAAENRDATILSATPVATAGDVVGLSFDSVSPENCARISVKVVRGLRMRSDRAMRDMFRPEEFGAPVSELGAGSYGVVNAYRAAEGIIAMKEMKMDMRQLKNVRAQNIHELQVLGIGFHPNIAHVCKVAFGQSDVSNSLPNKLILMMDPAHASLGECIKRARLLVRADDVPRQNLEISPDEVCDFAYQMTRAVAYLHSRLVQHHDIKPGNFLVYAIPRKQNSKIGIGARIALTDFGLSSAFEFFPTAKPVLGTLQYQPPEWIFGSGLGTYAADVWALGCTIYELATGRRLFSADGSGLPPLPDEIKLNKKQQRRRELAAGMFAAMGVPPDSVRERWMPRYADFLAEKFPAAQVPLAEKLRADLGPRFPESLVDLLLRTLDWEPNLRWSAGKLMREHPYFAQVRGTVDADIPAPEASEFPPIASSERQSELLNAEGVISVLRYVAAGHRSTLLRAKLPQTSPSHRLAIIHLLNLHGDFVDSASLVLAAALTYLRAYAFAPNPALRLPADADDARCRRAAAACYHLALLYREWSTDKTLFEDYVEEFGKDAIDGGLLSKEFQTLLEAIDFDVSVPTIYDFIRQFTRLKATRAGDDSARIVSVAAAVMIAGFADPGVAFDLSSHDDASLAEACVFLAMYDFKAAAEEEAKILPSDAPPRTEQLKLPARLVKSVSRLRAALIEKYDEPEYRAAISSIAASSNPKLLEDLKLIVDGTRPGMVAVRR